MVLACNLIFLVVFTGYRFYIRRENRRLDEGGPQAIHARRFGITQEQADLGWRYAGF
jgi:hypothetical protein